MGKPRGKYDKSAKIEQTDRETAGHFIELLQKEFEKCANLGAIFYHLGFASPAVRQQVFEAFSPTRRRPRGHPPRMLPDLDILYAVESEKEALAARLGRKVTDRMAIRSLFDKDHLRLGRREGDRYSPYSTAGKQEMARAVAALGRARKTRKSKITPA